MSKMCDILNCTYLTAIFFILSKNSLEFSGMSDAADIMQRSLGDLSTEDHFTLEPNIMDVG